MDKFGEKNGQCGCCDKENVPIQHSLYFGGWLCESCWDSIAESAWNGEYD